MRRLAINLCLLMTALVSLFAVSPAFATVTINGGTAAGPDLGEEYPAMSGEVAVDPRYVVANIIRIILSVLGMLAVVLIIYAGFRWMTAGGNDEQIGEAKKILFASVIGLAIILSAYSIALFVTRSLLNASAAGTSIIPT